MNLFKRLMNYGSSEAHGRLDQIENPIRMSEQAIRNLKGDLDQAVHSLAEVKAVAIRSRRELDTHTAEANDYKTKAMRLLQKAESGDLDANEADRLASQALEQKERAAKAGQNAKQQKEKYDKLSADLEYKIQDLRQQIQQWENELKTLKARSKVSNATTKINKQMANIDSSSTIATLERMRERVDEEEALAESYGDIADSSHHDLDGEIDSALESSASSSQALADLKQQMRQNAGT